jgi:hypothetical protein
MTARYINAMKNPEYADAVKKFRADSESSKEQRPVASLVKSRTELSNKLKAGFVCTWREYTCHFSMNEATSTCAAGAWALWGKPLTAIVTADTTEDIAAKMDRLAPFEKWNFE